MNRPRMGLTILFAATVAEAFAGCGSTATRPGGGAAAELPESELRVGNGPMRTAAPVLAPDAMPMTPSRWLWTPPPGFRRTGIPSDQLIRVPEVPK